MTGEQLREELTRVADAAPTVEVPDDLFARGRRATMRARALAGAAAVACLALVAAVTVPLIGNDDTEVADRHGPGGVPDVIYAPDPLEQSLELPITPLDEVGRAAAAYQVGEVEGTVVLVTPDGDYHAVLLPDRYKPMLDEVGPTLSPDGTRIAYTSDRGNVRRLSIADLTTGDVREVILADGLGALARQVQWSPDSRWLVWKGQLLRSATESSTSYHSRSVAGIIGPTATVSELMPALGRSSWSTPGVCDDGTPVRTDSDGWRHRTGFLVGDDADPPRLESWQDVAAEHGRCTPPTAFAQVQLADHHDLLGWITGGSREPVAVITTPRWTDESKSSFDGRRLRLVLPDGTTKQVGIATSGVEQLSVATGLMSLGEPTVPATANPWARPWLEKNWIQLAILAVLGLGALLLAWRVRRAVRG